jgi:hypothetical protein
MISFQRIPLKDVKWEDPRTYDEINVFQTLPWLNFLAETQKAEPVLAAVESDGHLLGYFIGLTVNKYGIKVLGSPFRGWGTYFMGFSMVPGVSRREALEALPAFAFKELGCHYLEVVDPCLCASDWAGSPYKVECLDWFAIDLTKSEDELFRTMKHSARNCIRQSIKNGVTIEEASDIGFAEEYYDQYKDVLAKRSMAPAYSLDYVQKMIGTLLPTGHLLLLRAKSLEGLCVATGIFLALNKTAVFWGAASWREHQHLRPNEPLAWCGMQKLKARGIHELHFGGQCEQYKEKLGCDAVSLHRLMKARYEIGDRLLEFVTSPKSARYKNWVLRRL